MLRNHRSRAPSEAPSEIAAMEFSTTSADELLVPRDDGEVHVARAAMVRGAVRDLEAAHVVGVHRFERADEGLAREVLAGAAHSLDDHLGRDEAFEAGKVGVAL